MPISVELLGDAAKLKVGCRLPYPIACPSSSDGGCAVGELYAVGDVIAARRADDPLAPVLVVARDRIHAELLGRRLATAGIGALSPGAQGTFGVRVGTVEDVAERTAGDRVARDPNENSRSRQRG